MKYYEELIGLSELKQAQRLVLEAERDFTKTQEARREKQDEFREIQTRLKEIHLELDKTARGEDRYLTLLTQEHAIIKQERQTSDDFRRLERAERDCFTNLSNRLRDSHEKEREQAEKTKYMSIIGSILCGFVGVVGGLVVNRMRMRDLKVALSDASAAQPSAQHLHVMAERLCQAAEQQQRRFNTFIDELNALVSGADVTTTPTESHKAPLANSMTSPDQFQVVLDTLKQQDERLSEEMVQIKRLIATERGLALQDDADGATRVVYVGPEMRSLLDATERKLERNIKLNSLAQVVLIYAALAVAVPVLAACFRN